MNNNITITNRDIFKAVIPDSGTGQKENASDEIQYVQMSLMDLIDNKEDKKG